MKKSMLLVLGALLVAVSAQAAVTVKQGNKTIKYKDGQEIRVTGAQSAKIDYNGVKITVPQGVKAVIGQNKDGSVRVTGSNLSNVQVNGTTFNSANASEVTSFSVSADTGKFSVHSGSLLVTTPQGHSVPLTAGAVFTPASGSVAVQPAAAAALPAFVNEALEPSTVAQQATQNVVETEEKVLSPSAPR